MNIYCKELKDTKYKTVLSFIEDFYSTKESKATYFLNNKLQCKKDKRRSLEELLLLCKYHVHETTTFSKLIKGLYKFSINTKMGPEYRHILLCCNNIHKIVFYHGWCGSESFIKAGGSYAQDLEAKYVEHGIFEGLYRFSDVEKVLKKLDKKKLKESLVKL